MQLLKGVLVIVVVVVVVASIVCDNSLPHLPQVNMISSCQVPIDLWGSMLLSAGLN